MTRTQTLLAAALAMVAFNVPATDTDRALENQADQMEDRADDVRDRGENQADAIEAADPGMDSDATDNAPSRYATAVKRKRIASKTRPTRRATPSRASRLPPAASHGRLAVHSV